MTEAQLLNEIRKELAINERLAGLIETYAKTYADDLYRRTSNITGHVELVHVTSKAAAVESFANKLCGFQDSRKKGHNNA